MNIEHVNNLFSRQGTVPGTHVEMNAGFNTPHLDAKYFIHCELQRRDAANALYVDGGIAEIIKTPSASLYMMRVCGIVQQQRRIVVRKDYLMTMTHAHTWFVTDMKGQEDIAAKKMLAAIQESVHGKEHNKEQTLSTVRTCLEWSLAVELGRKYAPALIVLDGTLQAEDKTKETLLRQLAAFPCVVGVSKTSELVTNTGMPASIALQRLTMLREWVYIPLAEHQAGTIGMARFHEKSLHCFRLDFLNAQKQQWENACAVLRSVSNDAAFPGYPYGLILVDALARIPNQEKEMLQAKLQTQKGWKDLRQELAAMDAHSILDSMQF